MLLITLAGLEGPETWCQVLCEIIVHTLSFRTHDEETTVWGYNLLCEDLVGWQCQRTVDEAILTTCG